MFFGGKCRIRLDKFIFLALLVLFSLAAFPPALFGPAAALGADRVVVRDEAVNLRTGPGTNHGLAGQAFKGEVLEVTGKEGDWYRVRKDGAVAWVAGWLVETKQGGNPGAPGQASAQPGGSTSFTAEITDSGVNVRSGPGTSYNVVGRADRGNKFTLLDKSGDWYKIAINGGSGWVHGQYVKALAGDPAGETTGFTGWAVINGSGVNIRNGPGTGYQVVTRANRGDRYLLADSSADWYKIVLDDGKPGWVAGWLVNVERKDAGGNENPAGGGSNPAGGGVIPAGNSPAADGGGSKPAGDNMTSRGGGVIPPPSIAGNERAAAAGLKSVSARVESGKTVVDIEAEKGVLKYGISSLNDPDRLVIDLEGVEPGPVPERISLSSTLAGGVRVGWFSRSPNITRVVLDLKQPARYEKSQSSDGSRLQVILTPRTSRSLSGATIVLDPGHGGSDPGATGPSGLLEKDINLDIARKTAEHLKKQGAKVLLTRNGDTHIDLTDRPNLAARNGAAVFVSIHANASPRNDMNGTSTYYLRDADQGNDQVKFEGMYLAKYLQKSLVNVLKRPDRGVLQANYTVLSRSKVPSALVEVAYISNPEEEKLLRDAAFRDRVAQGIAQGIADYFAAK